jgi:hypothetical protein
MEDSKGRPNSMSDLIPNIEHIMHEKFDINTLPPSPEWSLVNQLVCLKTYNEHTQDFSDHKTIICILSYF